MGSTALWMAMTAAFGASDGQTATVPYDAKQARWLFHPAGIVSRNDVVYVTPSVQPWEAMPTGGGDLSAMVRFDGDLHLHLTKSDAWGFQAPPEAKPGTRYFNNVSPGHIRVVFGAAGKAAAKHRFRQRLDLYHGRVVVEVGEEDSPARIMVWGHPRRKLLVVEMADPKGHLGVPRVELSEWRETMALGASVNTLTAREVHERPARPHLANTGMQDYFDEGHDPLKGRGLAVAVGVDPGMPTDATTREGTASFVVPESAADHFTLFVAAAVTPSGSGEDPLDVAKRSLAEAKDASPDALRAEHRAWWRDYWRRSFLRITSQDDSAERLCAAYHVHLYTLGCVNRGPVPAKWDGGPGLIRGDERTWGLAEWVQEIRFTFMPLYAANRIEMARGLCDHYTQMADYLRGQTQIMWGLPGVWIPETVLPWGHAEDWILKDDGRGAVSKTYRRWDPTTAPFGEFELYNPYVGLLFTAGLEVCHHYLTYYDHTGDEAFLRQQAYPMIRDVCAFVGSLVRKGEDDRYDRYHLDPANALETWWSVRDPADTLDGIRAVFRRFIALSEQRGQDSDLRGRCAEILTRLPEPSLGLWSADGRIDPSVDVYAPAASKDRDPARRNSENPQLYRVYPFGLSGIGSADYERAKRTFDHRICPVERGWSMDAIWAARLGLAEQARELAAAHAAKFNRYRYGGWDSGDSNVFPGGLSVVPFTDAGGLSAFALQEMLLQSHGGIVRVLPAASRRWSGIFRLRARGGFLVAADFVEGRCRFIEIVSLLGKPCTVANPWPGAARVRLGRSVLLQTDERSLAFDTDPGKTYTLEPIARPLESYQTANLSDESHQGPGMPGRD